MADIISRLFQLTATSPSLVIIGCDKASQQQQLQNEFLSRQDENAEVSFFAAEQHMNINALRKMIFQQFTQKNATDYRLEIKDLFTRQLSSDTTNVLCITQADNLPDQFAAELMSWVASIEAGLCKDNINILLFASQAWGEVKYSWLDKQSAASPIFISASTADAVGFDVNELEQLMSEQRAFFAKDGLFGKKNTAASLFRNVWFKSGIASIFLLFFSGMLAAQYSEQLFAFFNSDTFLPEQPSAQEAETANKPSSVFVESNAQALSSSDSLEGQISLYTDTTTSENEEKYASVTSEILAGSWQKDVDPGSDEFDTSNTSDSTDYIDSNDDFDDISNDTAPPTTVDFQVPDIISVAQLDEQLGELSAESQANNDSQIGEAADRTTTSIAPQPTFTGAGTPGFIRPRQVDEYNFDEELLLQLPNNQVVLQLSGMRDISILTTYLDNNDVDGDIWIYQTELNGGEWYVVLHGDTFDSDVLARNNAPSYPAGLFSARPFTKTIAQIRYEITGLY